MPGQPTPPPVLYTTTQVAEALGTSPRRVRELVKLGHISAVNVGLGEKQPRFRITAQAFEDFLAARRVVK